MDVDGLENKHYNEESAYDVMVASKMENDKKL
jgi:hypothetical protein